MSIRDEVIDSEWPAPEKVRAARQAVGLSQAQAAALVGLGAQSRWAEYEIGKHQMDATRWLLFLLLTDQHPTHQVKPRAPA